MNRHQVWKVQSQSFPASLLMMTMNPASHQVVCVSQVTQNRKHLFWITLVET